MPPVSSPFEAAVPILAGLHELSDRLDGGRLLGAATEPALAILERARLLLQSTCSVGRDAESRETTGPSNAQGGLAGWQLRAVTHYIDGHLDERLSLETLARVTRLSPSYLCRAFRRSLGSSPMQFVMQRRLKAAKTLLRRGPAPLREVALQCGFADQAHFTRMFHAATGETPRRWRQAWQYGADGAPDDASAGLSGQIIAQSE